MVAAGLTSVLGYLDIIVHGKWDQISLACCRSTAQHRPEAVFHQREVAVRWDEGQCLVSDPSL